MKLKGLIPADRLIKVHIKVNTGMNRLGWSDIPSLPAFIKQVMQLKNIDVEGLFTHFSSLFIDGNENKTATQNQLLKFENAIS